jgi:hypothetical protein
LVFSSSSVLVRFRSGSKTGGFVHLFIRLKGNAQEVRWLSGLTKYFWPRLARANYQMAEPASKGCIIEK